jgi:hypothetical protein
MLALLPKSGLLLAGVSAIAAALVYKVGTEQWQSVAEGAQCTIEKIANLVKRRKKAA